MEAATIAVNMIVISISAIFHEPFVGSRIIFSIGPAVETFKCAVIWFSSIYSLTNKLMD